jgi:hypothetical protein
MTLAIQLGEGKSPGIFRIAASRIRWGRNAGLPDKEIVLVNLLEADMRRIPEGLLGTDW